METKEGRALQGGCSNPKVSSLNGIKAIAMIMLFWWHSPIRVSSATTQNSNSSE